MSAFVILSTNAGIQGIQMLKKSAVYIAGF